MASERILRRVVLVKNNAIAGLLGGLPVGSKYEWTYTSSSPERAMNRAWRAFKRDHPDENPLCWQVDPQVYTRT